MTEVPEHLLRRSQQRRAAMGGGGGSEGGGDAPSKAVEPAAAATPAAARGADAPARASAAPAEGTVPTEGFTGPPPRPPRRERVPLWAMPVLAILPLWAIGYAGAFGERGNTAPVDPVVVGQSLYASCSGCHGPAGAGQGAFPALTNVQATFPDFEDHVEWVRTGSVPFRGQPYGATRTIASGLMPGFPQFSEEQLIAVTCYERVRFGGQDIAELPQCTEEAAIARGAGGGGGGATAGAH